MPQNSLTVQPGTRTLVAGKTGSGKSVFMAWLTHAQPLRAVILDTKLDQAFSHLPDSRVFDGLDNFSLSELDAVPFAIVRPQPDELDHELLDAWLLELYDTAHNLCIVIDELYSVTSGTNPGAGLRALYTRGRSRNLSLIGGVQRPVWIPLFCISEADYVAEFLLQWPADRERLAAVTVPELSEAPIDRFSFWWYKTGENEAVQHVPIKPLLVPRGKPVIPEPERVRLI